MASITGVGWVATLTWWYNVDPLTHRVATLESRRHGMIDDVSVKDTRLRETGSGLRTAGKWLIDIKSIFVIDLVCIFVMKNTMGRNYFCDCCIIGLMSLGTRMRLVGPLVVSQSPLRTSVTLKEE